MKKIFFCTSILIVFLFFTSISTLANEVNVVVNGQRIEFPGQQPIVTGGRTLVPVRAVFEAIGFNVSWNPELLTATISRGSDTIVITVGNDIFFTNEIPHRLDVPAQLINGRTLIPIRLPLESVGYSVGWNSSTNTVLIPAELAVTEDTNYITLTNSTRMWLPNPNMPYAPTGNSLRLQYGPAQSSSYGFPVGVTVESSNPAIMPFERRGINENGVGGFLELDIISPGTTTVTLNDPARRQTARADITAVPITRTIALASQNGVTIVARGFMSQEQIRMLIPYARTPQETRSTTPHPARRMTEHELQMWIHEYNKLGGVNAFELEVLYLVNEFRAEEGLHPLILCPNLSMAARLATQMSADGHSLSNHTDPFYGSPSDRGALFRDDFIWGLGENLAWGHGSPTVVINAWKNSSGHRRNMLGRTYTYIGIGRTGSITAQKFSGI